MKSSELVLDHLVLGVPDLEEGAAQFEATTGVRPVFGGRHATGTANYLVGLGGDSYLEIIGILPEFRRQKVSQPFQLESLTGTRVVTWCLRSSNICGDHAAAHAAGLELGEVLSLSRQTPDGTLLSWRMTRRTPMDRNGLIPFLIDWGSTPHPTSRALPSVGLVDFALSHENPAAVRSSLEVLGQTVPVVAGPTGLNVTLDTPAGEVRLPS